MRSPWLLAALTAGLGCVPVLQAQAPGKIASPWDKVPALPTECYSDRDGGWRERNDAALAAVQQAHYRQNDINDAIRQNASDSWSADPMAVAQRMQQAMLDDPQNAQQMLEQVVQPGQQAQAELPARLAREQQIEAESKTLLKQYRAALQQAQGPGNSRLAALTKKYPVPASAGNLWLRFPDPGEPAWVRPEAHATLKDWDRAYVTTCAQWWSATGPFHAYMKRYKDFLVLERIPHEKKADGAQLEQYRQLQVPTTGWRTTSDYRAAEDYLKMARSIFDQRQDAPGCLAENGCQ